MEKVGLGQTKKHTTQTHVLNYRQTRLLSALVRVWKGGHPEPTSISCTPATWPWIHSGKPTADGDDARTCSDHWLSLEGFFSLAIISRAGGKRGYIVCSFLVLR